MSVDVHNCRSAFLFSFLWLGDAFLADYVWPQLKMHPKRVLFSSDRTGVRFCSVFDSVLAFLMYDDLVLAGHACVLFDMGSVFFRGSR